MSPPSPDVLGNPQDLGLQTDTLIADSDISETDSALGESVAGSDYSTSLASSVLNYQYENGRRYHAYHEGKYVLPNDEQEQERLDLHHHFFQMMLGGALFRAPLSEDNMPQRVLDLGCGTGTWAIQFSDEWPQTTVIGTDLSPIQPSWVPPNCRFYVDDIEGAWTYPPAEHFDYIHARAMLGSISGWKELFSRAYHHLNPGGILEIQDFPIQLHSDDPGLEYKPLIKDWVETLNEAWATTGRSSLVAHLLKSFMEEVGFIDVHQEIYKIPVGTWARGRKNKDLGEVLQALVLDAIEPYSLAIYTRILGWSPEKTRASIELVKRDIRDPKAHLYVTFYIIWGRRPEYLRC